jgi:DNA polymerase III epsilon subunit family exonuclease
MSLQRPFVKDLLVLDLETTGRDPLVHEVLEIGALFLDRTTLVTKKTFHSLLRPRHLDQADPASMRIHGLSEEQLRSAPDASEVVERFLDSFGTDFILCGWNIGFDSLFLGELLKKTGRNSELRSIDYHLLDLWTLANWTRVVGRIDFPSSSLSQLCEAWGLSRSLLHSALEDACLCAEVLRKLTATLTEETSEKRNRMDRACASADV